MQIETRVHVPQAGAVLTAEILNAEKAFYSKRLLRLAFLNAVNATSTVVVGRQAEIVMMMAAILSGNNVILWGDPGEGKSFMATQLLKYFRRDGDYGTSVYSTQFVMDMSDEPVLGYIPVERLMAGDNTRITDGRLPEANLAFLDEIGKASSVVHSALMSMLNERTYYNGKFFQQVPLISVIATTNESQFDCDGLVSRFLLKLDINRSSPDDQLIIMMRRADTQTYYPILDEHLIDMRQLYWARMSCLRVEFPMEVAVVVRDFAQLCISNGVKVDTRQLSNSIDFIKAYAWLTGCKKVGANASVTLDHLKVLPYLFKSTPGSDKVMSNLWASFTPTLSTTTTEVDPVEFTVGLFS